jgi:riboflavin biosynthesis pyrimidine reductase
MPVSSWHDHGVRRLLPGPVADLDDDELADALAFRGDGPWLRCVFAATLDGVIRGRDGLSGSIATPADKRVFPIMRRTADVILIGAGTLRAEDYNPSRTTIAVVTERLDLPADLKLFAKRTADTPTTLVLTTERAIGAADPAELPDGIELISCGTKVLDLSAAVDGLHQRGLLRIHCEGGPHLLSTLARAGLVDELTHTIVPTLYGAPQSEHLALDAGELDLRLRIVQVLEEDGTVFVRAVRRDADADTAH